MACFWAAAVNNHVDINLGDDCVNDEELDEDLDVVGQDDLVGSV